MEGDLDEEKQLILEQFRNNVEDVIQPHHDDRFLLRWLRARNFVLDKAEKMLKEDLKMREKLGCDLILSTYELKKEFQPYETTAFLGFDREGHLVRFFNVGESDIIGIIRSLSYPSRLRHLIFVMEHDLKMLKERTKKTGIHVDKCSYISDLADFDLRQIFNKEVIQTGIKLIKYYQDHYPDVLHIVHFINAPNFFMYVFNIFKPFLNETILKRIKISADNSWQEEVFQTIPREIVPAYIGGSRFEPEGDPKCHAILKWNKKIPTSLYLSECCISLVGDPGGHQKLVNARSSFELETFLERPGLILSWVFQTKEYDIKFGLFFRKKALSEDGEDLASLKRSEEREELMPMECVDCHQFAETGEFLCCKPGIYILYFDNTYSWMTPKHLYYKTEIRQATAYG